VTGFAGLSAAARDVRVFVPTHPGFGGTPRPGALNSVGGLAALYTTLLDQLGLQDVTVIGNSIGGWIAAEIALLKPPRVSGISLIDAVGIQVPGHPVADFFSLTMDQVFQRSFHNPGPFRTDPATTLAGRLGSLQIPPWCCGSSDRIVDADYGRAYAAATPPPGSSCSPAPATPRNSKPPTRSST